MPIAELLGVDVEVASATAEVANPIVDGPLAGGAAHLVADRATAVLTVPEVGAFAVAGGRSIRFEPAAADVPAGLVSMWLHGSVAALLLAQRGRFALHASVVEVDGSGIALTGERGAGKSTTALRLVQRGHRLVTDDVSPMDGDPVTVHGYSRPIHVFPQAAEGLGLDVSGARPIFEDHPKLSLPVPSGRPLPVAAIVRLGTGAEHEIVTDRLEGAQAHWLVSMNTYRTELLGRLWEPELFAWAGALAAKLPVYAVTRPADGWTVDGVADAVEQIARAHSSN